MAETTEATEEKAQEEKAQEEKQQQQNDAAQADSKTQVQSTEFSEATGAEDAGAEAAGAGGNIEILLDMNIPVTVAIGKKEMPVRRLLQLGPNSVLKLDKPIDAPVDLYLKDTKFATGNVVVVDGRFAVKIKEIISFGVSTGNPTDE